MSGEGHGRIGGAEQIVHAQDVAVGAREPLPQRPERQGADRAAFALIRRQQLVRLHVAHFNE